MEPADAIVETYRRLGASVLEARHVAEALLDRDPDERAFLSLVLCDGEIAGGGFNQLLAHRSGQAAIVAIEGAHRLGLGRHAQLLIRALAALWEQGERDPSSRFAELDEQWLALDPELQRGLLDYAESRRDT